MTGDGYATAAPDYWAAGWHAPLPLPPSAKCPPPKGWTGYNAPTPSYPDVIAWTEDHPDGNLGLRMPDTVIGIDVDGYDDKTGLLTIRLAEAMWGPLPDTWSSSSRDDGSAIRFYRVPAGTRLRTVVTFPDQNLGHVEIVQTTHRYAVVWPSIHPATGARYRWRTPSGAPAVSIPTVDDLPDLPARWLDELAAVEADVTTIDAQPVATTSGAPDLTVSTRLATAIDDLRSTDSRHDATCKHVLALLRLAEQGHDGTHQALVQLGHAFVASVVADGTRSSEEATAEYNRMVEGERGHALIAATPTPKVEPAPLMERAQTMGGLALAPQIVESEVVETATTPAPEPEPEPDEDAISDAEFWQSRPSLQAIYDTAHARLASPWSVLGATFARCLALVPPWITLPPVIGGRGSLNCFWALVGRSGAGKGISEAVAAHLVPLPDDIVVWPVGSGEGLAHAYVRRATAKEIKDEQATKDGIIRERYSAVFSVPEIDTLTSIGGRQGSTIMSKLRSAYSGEEIGFAYADPTKRLLVGSHQYRMQMILGVQPERAAGLLGDAAGGTPQRFVWLPANDPSIGDIEADVHPPLSVTDRKTWVGGHRHIDIPDMVADEVRAAHIARARGEGDAIDGHALQTREKVMVALTIADGRTTPDEFDWFLAGKIMAVSDRTRARIEREIAAATEREAEKAGREWGIKNEAAAVTAIDRRLRRIGGVIVRSLERNGPTRGWNDVLKSIASRDRAAAPDAVELLKEQGVVTIENLESGSRVTLVSRGPE